MTKELTLHCQFVIINMLTQHAAITDPYFLSKIAGKLSVCHCHTISQTTLYTNGTGQHDLLYL